MAMVPLNHPYRKARFGVDAPSTTGTIGNSPTHINGQAAMVGTDITMMTAENAARARRVRTVRIRAEGRLPLHAGELIEIADGAPGGAGGGQRVGAQRLRDRAIAVGPPGVGALRLHGGAPLGQRGGVDQHVDLSRRDVDADALALLAQRDGAPLARLGRDVTDAEARGAAREAAGGEQRAGLAQPLALQVRRRLQL